jgi:AcrR family transcriptional regulator
MDRKAIQTRRMRGYFIDAAKEILKGEGLKSISVRNIADRAGYSYATLYNYFSDLKGLIFECVRDFDNECRHYVNTEAADVSAGRDRIAAKTMAYVRYFIQYPGIFELFFLENLHSVGGQPAAELVTSALERLTREDIAAWLRNDGITSEEAAKRITELNYSIHGLLLFYINRKWPSDFNIFITECHNRTHQTLSAGY